MLQASKARPKLEALQKTIEGVIRGKHEVVRHAITGLLAEGHILFEDLPGVGKTTLAHSLASAIDLSFTRIQFTSDMLPSDILGVTIYDPEKHEFEFRPGPIFAHIVVVDEINRTTPKTQSALLQAMNTAEVSMDKQTYPPSTVTGPSLCPRASSTAFCSGFIWAIPIARMSARSFRTTVRATISR
jgi:MoxR-like ATPase